MKFKFVSIFLVLILYSGGFGQDLQTTENPGKQLIVSRLSSQNALENNSENRNTQSASVVVASAIAGHVYETDGSTPIANTMVRIYDTSWNQVGYIDYTNSSGYFIVAVPGAGNYYAYASGEVQGKGSAYFEEYYLNSETKAAATQIAVADSDTVSINFTLARKGSIAGRVCESDGTTPIANTMVNIYNSSWEGVNGAQTNASGYYTVYGLLAGDYYVESSGYIVGEGEFYIPEYWNNASTKAGATSVSVSPPNTVENINFSMTTGMHIHVYSDPSWAGWATVSPQKLVYEPNESVELYATVSGTYPDYRFDHWGGDHSGTDNPTTVVLDSDKDVTVYFVETTGVTYNLNVTVVPSGAGSIIKNPDAAKYDSAAVVSLTAESEAGWTFKEWTGDATGTENPIEIVMNFDKYITGNFGHWLQTLSYPTEGGTVTLNPDKEVYDHNEVVNISAEPAEGYYFKFWEGGGIAESDSANTTVTMDENRTITAKFQEIVTETVTLTMRKEPEAGGTINPPPGTYTYYKGDTVDISATAAEGYRFKKWQCSVEDPYDPTTVVYMNYNETVTAVFESDSVTLHLKVFPEEGGTTNPPPGIYTYERDDTVDIEAFPAEGYRFLKWECNVEDPYDRSTVVYLPGNETVTARFDLITYKLIISVDPEEGGTTEPAVGTHEYEPGTTVQVTAVPAEGYEFVNWIGPVSEPDSQTTSITMDGKRAITANFQKIGYTLTLQVHPQAGGTTDPDPGTYTYSAGEIVELTAIPKQGYQFTGWSGEVSDKDSIHTTVLINTNKTVTAGFDYIDTIPPELKNCHPCPHAKAVPRNTHIKFKLYDQKSGLNSNTLNVWMNDLQIIKEGINQKGDEVQLVHNAHILKITYKPAESFENGTTVSVSVSCSDNAPAANHVDSTYSFEVGTASINKTVKDSVDEKGGSVVDTTSNITIQVPPQAVDDTTEITIDHIENAPALPEDVSGIATPYHFGPDGYEFKVPVVICIPYTQAMLDSAGITDPMKLNLYYFHSLTGEWTKLIIDSVNTGQKILYITVDQFCYFNLVKEKTQTAIDNPMINESNNPDDFYRLENYPNPFNPETHIQFSIQNAGYVILSVYNMKGNLIRILVDEPKQKGEYDVIWDGMDHNNHQVSTGIYIVRMKVGNQMLIRKVTLLK